MSSEVRAHESRVVYDDADHGLRSLYGMIIAEDEYFVTLKRRDGTFRIAKRTIRRIEDFNSEEREGEGDD